MRKLDAAACDYCVDSGEFPPEVLMAAASVAVVMTQDWCPQWTAMRSWLERFEREDTVVWYVEYNREPSGERFMRFKEDSFGNRLIPYVRYYRNGTLVAQGNYTDELGFTTKL
jgi:hypothetical protein